MKSWTYLFLSVYMLLLSVLPCTDGCLQLRSVGKVSTVAADHHQHEGQATSDLCSPFCGCVCCGTVLDTPPVFSFQPVHQLPADGTRFAGPLLQFPSPALSTWQPPQLA
ncbi:DUF6660 family protein [Nibrella saemangeumensis]|uniref:DUF6660 family protein n=1 Tax=Nibrella saemangeumensis TaxID=1084526 RepID=UPI0031EE3DF7